MPEVEIDLNKTYILTNNWSGPTKALGSPSSHEVLMVDANNVTDTNQWKFVETSRSGYYRLHTLATGPSRVLDVINDDGTASKHVHLTATGNYSGQFWRLDSWPDGTVKLTNSFTGRDKNLDVYADTYGPHLAPGECIGQHWTVREYDPPRITARRPPASASDQVRDLHLETETIDDVTYHSYTVSRPQEGQRQVQVNERWRKQRTLGAGAFGTVSLELCILGPVEGKLRAVKKIEKLEEYRDRIDYNRELEAMAKFKHPRYVHCFVETYAWWETNNAIHIAMEYVEKGDLHKYMGMPFSEAEAKEIISQLLEGLQFMHDQGFAHRDIKPQNILVFKERPSWWVKISDFGISKRVEDLDPSGTALRTQIGTPGYTAPEVVGILPIADLELPQPEVRTYTRAVDIWALGMIAFRLLTCAEPFAEARALSQYVTLGRPFPKDALLGLDLSPACIDFVERALAASAARRPSARDLLGFPWMRPL